MTTPVKTKPNYKNTSQTSTIAPEAYTEQVQESSLEQQQQDLMQMQHNIMTASPLQHLNNIFGLSFNNSSPVLTNSLDASPTLHLNNLQHLFGEISCQRKQQVQQIYQELYGNILPQQHQHMEQQIFNGLTQPFKAHSTSERFGLLKNETYNRFPLPIVTQTTATIINSSTTLSPLETVSLNHRLLRQPHHNDGNMALLEQQVNETTHANQKLQQRRQQQQLPKEKASNNKLLKGQTTSTSTLASVIAATAVAQAAANTSDIKSSVANLSTTSLTPVITAAAAANNTSSFISTVNNFGKSIY